MEGREKTLVARRLFEGQAQLRSREVKTTTVLELTEVWSNGAVPELVEVRWAEVALGLVEVQSRVAVPELVEKHEVAVVLGPAGGSSVEPFLGLVEILSVEVVLGQSADGFQRSERQQA